MCLSVCLYACAPCVSVEAKESVEFPGTGVRDTVSCYLCLCWELSQVLCHGSQCSQLLNHLCSPAFHLVASSSKVYSGFVYQTKVMVPRWGVAGLESMLYLLLERTCMRQWAWWKRMSFIKLAGQQWSRSDCYLCLTKTQVLSGAVAALNWTLHHSLRVSDLLATSCW